MESKIGSRLQPGTRIGRYEIARLIGAGGMGEVYQARDTKLRRDVAIKILPASLARDPDRLQRFEREAHLLAALNHPHIAAIYGFEEQTGLKQITDFGERPTSIVRRVSWAPDGQAIFAAVGEHDADIVLLEGLRDR